MSRAKHMIAGMWLVSLIHANAFAEPWTQSEKDLQRAVIAVTLVDWLQTREIRRSREFGEGNVLLGTKPSTQSIDVYMLSVIAIHTLIADRLPKAQREIWQRLYIGVESAVIESNYSLGVRVSF